MTSEPDCPTLTERTNQLAKVVAHLGIDIEDFRRAIAALNIPVTAGRGQSGPLIRPDTPPSSRSHTIQPIALADANQFVAAHHLDDGQTVEITRLATDGTRNACSQLYAACRREARRRGYTRIVTYTLASESGASVRASGFTRVAFTRGRQWDTPTRRRKQRDTPDRWRWEACT